MTGERWPHSVGCFHQREDFGKYWPLILEHVCGIMADMPVILSEGFNETPTRGHLRLTGTSTEVDRLPDRLQIMRMKHLLEDVPVHTLTVPQFCAVRKPTCRSSSNM